MPASPERVRVSGAITTRLGRWRSPSETGENRSIEGDAFRCSDAVRPVGAAGAALSERNLDGNGLRPRRIPSRRGCCGLWRAGIEVGTLEEVG
ncbi:hypothetical protein GCM10009820_31740 [Leifsonia soli]